MTNRKSLLRRFFYAALVVFFVLGHHFFARPPEIPPADNTNKQTAETVPWRIEGRLERIVDGDSLYLRGEKRQIRLWAINAPEQDEPGYHQATRALRALAQQGSTLSCRIRDTDRYGRLIGQCLTQEKKDLGEALLDLGVVVEYCRFSKNFYGRCKKR